mgnify:CR=1 FL=1
MEPSELWESYRENDDIEARDALVEKHMGLVYHVAQQLMNTLHEDVDLEELVSAGAMGLMSALENYDHSRGNAFSTFAAPRIRGAILDDLRRQDPVPRSIRKKQRDVARARERLKRELKRDPTPMETAEELDIDPETLHDWKSDSEKARPVSLDRPLSDDENGAATPKEIVADEDTDDVEERINRQEEMEILQEEIADLDEQKRVVLSLYYFEGLKLREIAEVLGVTESRISQIRSQAVDLLRDRLSHLRTATPA